MVKVGEEARGKRGLINNVTSRVVRGSILKRHTINIVKIDGSLPQRGNKQGEPMWRTCSWPFLRLCEETCPPIDAMI